MKLQIAISGSYGGMNLGDEAILEGIIQELKNSGFDIDITVFSNNAKDTQERHKVKAISILDLHKNDLIQELKKIHLFIVGGGGIFFDGLVERFLREMGWAKELNIPIMVYAVSAGPLRNPDIKQSIVNALNNADIVTVRDSESKRILNDIGVTKEIEVTADPAFLIKSNSFSKDMLKKEGIDPDAKLIGFSVREIGPALPDMDMNFYFTLLANAADFMVERYDAQIVFVPMELGENRDQQLSHGVIAKMLNARKASVIKGTYTPGQLIGLIEHFDFAVGMRLHFLIFSVIKYIPFISLPYASKVKGLLEALDLPYTPLENWNSGRLCAVIDRAWDLKKTIKKKLEEKAGQLKENAKASNKLLCELLKKIIKNHEV